MSNRITIEELKSYLWNSAVLLRTNIDAGAYKQYIFPLLFFKRICDVYDEETAAAAEKYGDDVDLFDEEELHTFVVPKGHHWNDVRAIPENVGIAIVNAFHAIESANIEQLHGVFGDGAWTNKNRLPDALLKNLIEHFSTKTLSIANCPEDELGQGYEYLIKKFADDSGHTAQEFYTNRTVVHLMTEMLQPQPGESIYDPTCGSAGMLISCIAYLKEHGKEWRNVKVYGQEINQLTSAIGRMNLFLHGVKDFHIVNDDTLRAPAYIEAGKLKQFDLVLANPPYSIKQWDRAAFESDKYGRNFLGTPPQGRADYAFFQHILASLKPGSGRCAILFPHGILFRNEEKEMRKKLIQSDLVECVIGLGPNLFFNAPMEACIVICRTKKEPKRCGKVLFINAVKEVTRKNAQSYLEESHIELLQKDNSKLIGLIEARQAEYKELLVQHKALKALQHRKKAASKELLAENLVMQYAIREYLSLLLKRVKYEQELTKTEILFFDAFEKVIDGKKTKVYGGSIVRILEEIPGRRCVMWKHPVASMLLGVFNCREIVTPAIAAVNCPRNQGNTCYNNFIGKFIGQIPL